MHKIKRSRKLLQDQREAHFPGALRLQLGIHSKDFLSILLPVGSTVTIKMKRKNVTIATVEH